MNSMTEVVNDISKSDEPIPHRSNHSRPANRGYAPILLALYWVHLAIPLFLLSDALWAWRLGKGGIAGILESGVAILWLAMGLACFCTSALKRRAIPLLPKYLALVCFFFLALALTEFVVRAGFPQFANVSPGLFRVGASWSFRADPSVLPGVEGTKLFTTNELGLRGPAYPSDPHTYRIMAIGGSTTQCAHLDDSEAWPQLLMQELNQRQPGAPVWVNNAGKEGDTATHSLSLLRNLPAVLKADTYLFLEGINDLQATFSMNGEATQEIIDRGTQGYLDSLARTNESRPLIKRLVTFRLLRNFLIPYEGWVSPAANLVWIQNQRQMRAEAGAIPMPVLSAGVSEYRARIQALGDECQRRSVRCIFLTQPTMWRASLPQGESKLLFFGSVGLHGTFEERNHHPDGFISVADMARAMDVFNQAMMSVCADSSLECYDLAAALPKDISVFYDDVHFNQKGARLVAQFLAGKIDRRPPLAR
jgi:lysophospholipase L1-like esterase